MQSIEFPRWMHHFTRDSVIVYSQKQFENGLSEGYKDYVPTEADDEPKVVEVPDRESLLEKGLTEEVVKNIIAKKRGRKPKGVL